LDRERGCVNVDYKREKMDEYESGVLNRMLDGEG